MTETTSPQPAAAGPEAPHVKTLKTVVVVLGIMIVLGLLTVIGRIVYLASERPRQASIAAVNARLAGVAKLVLPAGAHVRHVSLSGDLLAVHYEGPTGAAIAVVDLATGNVLSRLEIVPEVPR